jgi:preprotein translocase subunit SecG
MNIWLTLALVLHVGTALAIIGLVLLQHGKGADMGAAFGSGASGSVFGATGSANFLSRTTAVLAAVFFLTSLGLAHLATKRPTDGGTVMDAVPAPSVPAVPGAGASPAPGDASKGADPQGSKANEVPK